MRLLNHLTAKTSGRIADAKAQHNLHLLGEQRLHPEKQFFQFSPHPEILAGFFPPENSEKLIIIGKISHNHLPTFRLDLLKYIFYGKLKNSDVLLLKFTFFKTAFFDIDDSQIPSQILLEKLGNPCHKRRVLRCRILPVRKEAVQFLFQAKFPFLPIQPVLEIRGSLRRPLSLHLSEKQGKFLFQFLIGQRLQQICLRSQLQRPFGIFKFRVAGKNQKADSLLDLSGFLHQLKPAHLRHPDIRHHNIHLIVFQNLQGFLPGCRLINILEGNLKILQPGNQSFPYQFFIIRDQQIVIHRLSPSVSISGSFRITVLPL